MTSTDNVHNIRPAVTPYADRVETGSTADLPAGGAGISGPSTLLPFIDLDRIGALLGVLVVAIANIAHFRIAAIWLVVPFLLGLVVVLTIARRAASDNRTMTALAWITTGNWTIAYVVAMFFPYLWPLMIMTILLPLVLAAPLLSPPQVRPAVAATALSSSILALIGLLNDEGGLTPDIADDLELIIVVAGLAGHILPIGAVIVHNNQLQTQSMRQAYELNTRLRASQDELAESRRRIVDAEDTERRRIERDLHDGAQQRLVALTLRLRLVESQLPDDSSVQESVGQLVAELDGAVEELRELAQGIYPPVLQARGLSEALRSVGRRSVGSVDVDAGSIGRLDQSLETALYYVALEAVANAMKHAPTAPIQIGLHTSSESVILKVVDQGTGFDPSEPAEATGLLNMRDRISAVDGALHIESEPGSGTAVTATAPIARPQPV